MNVERTMEFILKLQAKAEVEMAAMREQQVRYREDQARYEAKARREMDAIRTLIRAGMKMIVKNEALVKEVTAAQKVTEAKLKELAAAQTVTEGKLQGFIDSLRRGGNGHSRRN